MYMLWFLVVVDQQEQQQHSSRVAEQQRAEESEQAADRTDKDKDKDKDRTTTWVCFCLLVWSLAWGGRTGQQLSTPRDGGLFILFCTTAAVIYPPSFVEFIPSQTPNFPRKSLPFFPPFLHNPPMPLQNDPRTPVTPLSTQPASPLTNCLVSCCPVLNVLAISLPFTSLHFHSSTSPSPSPSIPVHPNSTSQLNSSDTPYTPYPPPQPFWHGVKPSFVALPAYPVNFPPLLLA